MCMSPARARLGNGLCPCVASLVCVSLFHLVLDPLDSLFLSVACCSLACVLRVEGRMPLLFCSVGNDLWVFIPSFSFSLCIQGSEDQMQLLG